MDIRIVIVMWSILCGLLLWILIWDIKLLKINAAIRKRLRQAQEEVRQLQSNLPNYSDTEQKLTPSYLEQSNHKVDRTPHSPS